jgi:Mycoplasma protein of unknown function, DUF285
MNRTEQEQLPVAEDAEDITESSNATFGSDDQLKVSDQEFDQISLTAGGELHELDNWTILDAKRSIALTRLARSDHPQDSTNILNDSRQFQALLPSLDVSLSNENDTPDNMDKVPSTGDTDNGQLSPILCAKWTIALARRLREADLSLPHEHGESRQSSPKLSWPASHWSRHSHSKVSLAESTSSFGVSIDDETETVVEVMGFYPTTATVDDERERIIREAKQKLTSEVPRAEPVDVEPIPNKQRTPTRFIFATVSLLVVICVIGVAVWHTSSHGEEAISIGLPQPTLTSAIHVPTMAPVLYLEDGRRAFTTNGQLCAAVDEYVKLQNKGELSATSEIAVMYGYPIGTWDVSRVTNFDRVFANDRNQMIDPMLGPSVPSSFDDDLSLWDTSNAVTMIGMFQGATSFSGKGLEKWSVSKVDDFSFMFEFARNFVGNVSAWNTSSAVNMRALFRHAEIFNGDVSHWNVSRVETMTDMFNHAYEFEGGDLRTWNTSSVLLFDGVFSNAWLFSGKVSTWDTRKAISMEFMVSSCTAIVFVQESTPA